MHNEPLKKIKDFKFTPKKKGYAIKIPVFNDQSKSFFTFYLI